MAKTVTWNCQAASNSDLSRLVGSGTIESATLRVDNNSSGKAYAYYKEGYLTFGANSNYTPIDAASISSIELQWNAWTSSAFLAADLICHSVKADGTEGSNDTVALKYNGQNSTQTSSLSTAAMVNNSRVQAYIKLLHKGITSYCCARTFRVKIVYEPRMYTIAVRTSGAGSVTGAGSYEKGTRVNLTATAANGYIFSHWSDGNISPNRTITVTRTADYTAIFLPINAYTIAFDGNGATAGSMAAIQTTLTENVTLNNAFSREHIVRFDACGGTGCVSLGTKPAFRGFSDANDIVYSGTKYRGETFDAPYYANTYQDLHQTFKYRKYKLVQHFHTSGKSEGRSAVGTQRGVYPNGTEIMALTTKNETVTLKAEWTFPSITLPETYRPGYNLMGWYSDSAYTTKIGNAGDAYTPTASLTLYAKWEKKYQPPIISVSVNPNPANAGQGYIIAVGFQEA